MVRFVAGGATGSALVVACALGLSLLAVDRCFRAAFEQGDDEDPNLDPITL